MRMSEKVRDPFFDVVKAAAIMLVVFGHVVGLLSAPNLLPCVFDNVRIGFNMPIFFLIAGWFAWPGIEKRDWRKLLLTLRSYFMPTLFVKKIF